LLLYSRVGSRGKPFARIDSAEVLTQALLNLTVAIAESGANIVHGTLPTLVADESQLIQLFQNLIANALKFHRAEQAPEIQVSARRESGAWVFEVKDNGIGIEPKYADRIFQMFQRLHSRDKYPGMGIGLAVCKKIVERHGGRIWIESRLGEGSTFFFTIPDSRETPGPPTPGCEALFE